jgi:parallel beta-helix repeat protein
MKTMLRLAAFVLTIQSWSLAEARTWRVEKDGSGDFTVIQDAINAASSGDVVQIGPGVFQEYAWAWNNTQHDVYSCARAFQSTLTIVGAGVDETLIGGFALADHPHTDINAVSMVTNGTLHVRNLSLAGVDEGVHFEGGTLDISGCLIRDCRYGIYTWGRTGNVVTDCVFRENDQCGIIFVNTTDNIIVRNCEVLDSGVGIYVSHCGHTLIENCRFRGGYGGLQIVEWATASVRGCQFFERSLAAVWISSSYVDVSNCHISPGLLGLEFENWGSLTGSGNVLEGCSEVTLRIGADADQEMVDFHGNHILNGGGFSVSSTAIDLNCPGEPCHIDLSGNYWGTDDPAQISSWIDDYHDYHHLDSTHRVIVDFTPFSAVEVLTERTSLGSLKSLFR